MSYVGDVRIVGITRGWFAGWSAFVAGSWVVLALLNDDGGGFSSSSAYAPRFTFGETLVILFIPAAIFWLLGLIVLHVALRFRSRSDDDVD